MLGYIDAYKILGVKEGAKKDEIIKRYNILLKRYKFSQTEGMEPEIEIDDISKAYNLLMGYSSVEQEDTRIERKDSAIDKLLKKIGIDPKKAANFFYYYKFHILIIVIAVLMVGFFVKDIVTRVEPELNVIVAGEFYTQQTESLAESMKSELSGVKEISLQLLYLSDNSQSQQDYAVQMKFITLMAAGDIDIFVLDRNTFEKYASQGAFLPLDENAVDIRPELIKDKGYIIKDNDSGEEHLFGINVSQSALLSDLQSPGDEKIVAVRNNAKHLDKALKLLQLLVGK